MEDNKYLTEFEEKCVWMSIRHCIGGRSIVTRNHANDIIKYVYNRLPEHKRNFIMRDISYSINLVLKNIGVTKRTYAHSHSTCILINMFDYINRNGSIDKDINSMLYTGFGSWKIERNINSNCVMDKFDNIVDDLMPWYKALCVFDIVNHVMRKDKEGNLIECFSMHVPVVSNGVTKYETKWYAVDDVVKHPEIMTPIEF